MVFLDFRSAGVPPTFLLFAFGLVAQAIRSGCALPLARRPERSEESLFAFEPGSVSAKFLVVHPTHKPTPARPVVINAIQSRAHLHLRILHRRDHLHIRRRIHRSTPARIPAIKLNLQIPFLLLPCIPPPPIPRNLPRPRRRHHPPIQTAKNNFRRPPFAPFHPRRQTRPENPTTRRRPPHSSSLAISARQRFVPRASRLSPRPRFIGLCKKLVHPEFPWTMRIRQFRRTDIRVAYQFRQPRHGQLQFFRVRRIGHK